MPDPPPRRLADRVAAVICRWRVAIVVLGVIATAACAALTAWRMEFQSDRNDLLSPDIAWNERFIDWMEGFPGSSDIIVVVESSPDDGPRRAAAMAFVGDLVGALHGHPSIGRVEWGARRSDFTPKAARLAPIDRFREWVREARQASLLLESDSPGELLYEINRRILRAALFGGEDTDRDPRQLAGDLDGLTRMIQAIHQGFEDPALIRPAFKALLDEPDDEPWVHLESPNGRLVFVQVSPRREKGTVNASADAIAATRRVIAQVKQRHKGIEVGLTGVEVVDSDETAVASVDSAIASIVAVVLIAALLVGAFHSFRLPLILIAALLIGVGWSFGFLVLAIGHLQVLSVVFVVVLLGLGVDFGIHLMTTYEQCRLDHPDGAEHFEPALAESLRLCGPGIAVGALTTAAAFMTTAFTDFRGVAEMGIIASGGVLLCMLSTFTVLPALMRLFRHSHRHVRHHHERRMHIFSESWIMPICRRPRVTLALAAVVLALAVAPASRVRFVYDLIALQPKGVESVMWQHRLITDGNVSIYFGVSVTDSLEEARERDAAFMKQPTVAGVGGIGIIFPDDEPAKIAMIKAARAVLEPALVHAATPVSPPRADKSTTRLTTEVARLARRLGLAGGQAMPPEVAAAIARLHNQADETTALFRTLPLAERMERVAAMDMAYLEMRAALGRDLSSLLDPTPLGPEDLPQSIMRPYIDDRDPDHLRYCLHVYPRLPADLKIDNPLAPEFLPMFVADLKQVDPLVTGSVMQIHNSADLILSSYLWAGAAALGLVFLFVLLSFESIHDAVLAMLPVVMSFTFTFAIMALAGVSLNPANLMVLPLMFGIGVDAGIHVLHRARTNGGARPIGLTHGTGKGITLTCLTTMIGFATMMLARHRGVASLGFVLTLGIGFVILICWTVLPAWLELRRRRVERRGGGGNGAGEPA